MLAACAALAGRHVLPFCYWLGIGFLFSVRLGAAEKIFTLCENSYCIMQFVTPYYQHDK